MKLIHSILLLPLIESACSPTHSTRYIIEGEGVDSTQNGKYLYLQRYDDRSIIDSARVVKQRYVFHGDIDTAVYCYIDTKSWSTVQFMLEPGTIRIHTENRNLRIVGINKEDSFEDFTRTVRNQKWAWNQIHDVQETALNAYGIESIPFVLLLLPDGVMVARNLRGEKMVQLVKQLLDKNNRREKNSNWTKDSLGKLEV